MHQHWKIIKKIQSREKKPSKTFKKKVVRTWVGDRIGIPRKNGGTDKVVRWRGKRNQMSRTLVVMNSASHFNIIHYWFAKTQEGETS